jgi:hypothetical protein
MLCAFAYTCALLAQNNEVSLYTAWLRHDSIVRPTSTKVETISAGMLSLAQQVAQTPIGRLSLELPILWTDGKFAASSRPILGRSAKTVFITPGLRLTHPCTSRISLIATAGLGLVATNEKVSIERPNQTITADGRRSGIAGSFGGGIDVRATRRFSFRFEVRDFVTRKGSTLYRRHNVAPMLGIAFHY